MDLLNSIIENLFDDGGWKVGNKVFKFLIISQNLSFRDEYYFVFLENIQALTESMKGCMMKCYFIILD